MSTTTSYAVSGMTCDHCVRAVTQEVSAIDGVERVDVDLVPEGRSTVTVSSSRPLGEDEVSAALDEAGYELAGATS